VELLKRAALALVILLAAAPTAGADELDYLPDNPEWNGCTDLASLARGMQLRIELLEQLDWSRLPETSTLLMLYPTADLDPQDLVRFLQNGGKVLLADDFGRSDPLLLSLGIRRVAGRPVATQRYHNNNIHLPLATGGPAMHQLAEGVHDVVTNHPAVFRSAFPTLVGFGKGQQLVVAGRLGNGRFVALADPSVLINGMQKFEGNATLARNILDYLRPGPAADRIYLVSRHFRVTAFGKAADAPKVGGVQRFLTDYSRFLGRMNDFAPTLPTFRALGVVAGFLGLVALASLVPLPRRELSGHWLRPGEPERKAAADKIGILAAEQSRQTAAFSAAILRDEMEEILTEALEAPGLVFTIHSKWVVRRVREIAGEEAARLIGKLIASMQSVSQSVSLGGIASLGIRRGDLATMYDQSRRLLILLGRDPLPDVSSRARANGPDR